jgi:hypothetical protein
MVEKKNIVYSIVLTLDGKQKKRLLRTKDRELGFSEYRKLLKANKEIIFPKRYNNTKSVQRCEYKILLLKHLGSEANRDGVNIFNNDWKILLEHAFDIEESFMMYRFDSRYERKTIFDLVEILLNQNNNFKEIIVVHNKILFYNEDYFDMVICKCSSDARRLNNILFNLFKHVKGNKYIFLGIAKPENISFLYDLIEEETQWSRTRIQRTTTRP